MAESEDFFDLDNLYISRKTKLTTYNSIFDLKDFVNKKENERQRNTVNAAFHHQLEDEKVQEYLGTEFVFFILIKDAIYFKELYFFNWINNHQDLLFLFTRET